MRRSLDTLSAALVVGCLIGAGCGVAPAPMVPVENGKGDSTNQASTKYPAGPYGAQVNDVIANLSFVGKADDNGDGDITNDPIRKVQLSDYYNDKSIKVLAILVAAEWCGPCQQEQFELVTSFKKYQAGKSGVAYLEAMIESTNHSPADVGTVDRWAGHAWPNYKDKTMTAKIPFPVVADPTVVLAPYYEYPAFPMQVVIRASDMTIQWQGIGYGPGALEGAIDPLLSGQ